jgi:hypothetical protein
MWCCPITKDVLGETPLGGKDAITTNTVEPSCLLRSTKAFLAGLEEEQDGEQTEATGESAGDTTT